MLYVTTTFWLLVIVLSAWGVHQLWSGMVKPKVVNAILLPGTLAAQMGHVLGLLITGATVNNTTLYKDDETGAPQQTENAQPRIPVIGPVVIGLLPLLMCALAIFAAAKFLGASTFDKLTPRRLTTSLPVSLDGFWELLHQQLTLMQDTLAAALHISLNDWRPWAFVYLVICLTVRMAPFPGNLRGSLGAIMLVGVLLAVLGSITARTADVIESGWSVLTLSVATLLLLLMFSALIRGAVSLSKLLFKNA